MQTPIRSEREGTFVEKPLENKAFERLLTRLGGDTLSFPHPVEKLEVVQTHISIVLLTETFAYKIKKPVSFPFVDYSTLELREKFCHLELDLNRRLTEDIYLEVVPITRVGTRLSIGGAGQPVEYAVKMRRLPDDRRLSRLLETGGLPESFWSRLANRLAFFYGNASKGPAVSKWAELQVVAEDWRQILDQLEFFPPAILNPSLWKRLDVLSEENLDQKKGRISLRTKTARDGHGDLRMEHIYYFPDNPEPRDIAVIDCVEFNPRYRCCDPLSDAAFLTMDLETGGYKDQAVLFSHEFLKINGVNSNYLVDFYTAYRHLVRGLVRGLQAQDPEESPQNQDRARKKAHLHFLLALGKMEKPERKPCLILLGGLPGTGKSSLARHFSGKEEFRVFSSDVVRKELTGSPLISRPGAGFEKGIYKPEWTEKTYASLLQRTGESLLKGERVIVDASFTSEAWRKHFENLANSLGIPFLFFVCMVSHETAERRLSEARHFGSDADMGIYRKMAGKWDPPSSELGTLFLNTERPLQINLSEINRTLEQKGLTKSVPLRPVGIDKNFLHF